MASIELLYAHRIRYISWGIRAKLDDDNRPLGDDIHFNLPKGDVAT